MSASGNIVRLALRTRQAASKLASDIRGFAAVEFAMVVPVMVVMLLGSVELSDALTVDRRVTAIASSIADLVAQSASVSSADVKDIMRIGDSLLGKYSSSYMQLSVTSLTANAAGDATVLWSRDRRGGQPYAAGAPYPNLPAGLIDPNGGLIITNVKYSYRSPIGHFIHGPITLNQTFYLRPRKSLTVTMAN